MQFLLCNRNCMGVMDKCFLQLSQKIPPPDGASSSTSRSLIGSSASHVTWWRILPDNVTSIFSSQLGHVQKLRRCSECFEACDDLTQLNVMYCDVITPPFVGWGLMTNSFDVGRFEEVAKNNGYVFILLECLVAAFMLKIYW